MAAKRPAATAAAAASSSGARYLSRPSVGANSRTTARPAPVPEPGSSGASRSMACAAQTASMPSTFCALPSTSSALSAAVMPMLTWSSWSPELGIESTLAG